MDPPLEKIGNLTTEISKLTNKISSLKEKTESLSAEVSDTKLSNIETSRRLLDLDGDMTGLREGNKMLKQQNTALENKLTLLEYHQRRNNLLFDGIQEEYSETDTNCFSKVCDVIQGIRGIDVNTIKIARCHRFGPHKSNRTRPIMANFLWFGDVSNILQGRSKLPRGVYVNEDLPKARVERRRILRPVLKVASKMEK